jgi:hypothetical protein
MGREAVKEGDDTGFTWPTAGGGDGYMPSPESAEELKRANSFGTGGDDKRARLYWKENVVNLLHRLERLYTIGLVACTCTVGDIESYDNYNVVIIAFVFAFAFCIGLSSVLKAMEGKWHTISSLLSQHNPAIVLSSSLILRDVATFLFIGALTSGRMSERGIPSKWVIERLRFLPSSRRVARVCTLALTLSLLKGRTGLLAAGVGKVDGVGSQLLEEQAEEDDLLLGLRNSERRCWTTTMKYCLDWILSRTISSWSLVMGVEDISVVEISENGAMSACILYLIPFPSVSVNNHSCLHSTIHTILRSWIKRHVHMSSETYCAQAQGEQSRA